MVDGKRWKAVEDVLTGGLKDTYSAAVLLVLDKDRIAYRKAFGRPSTPDLKEITEDSIFDVASITKAVCTATLVMCLVRDSRMSLDDKISVFFKSAFLAEGLGEVTIEDLLSHSAGLKDYVPFFKKAFEKGSDYVGKDECRNFIFECARKEPPAYDRNEKSVYSDLGFMLLTEIVEKVTNRRFDALCSDIFKDLSMDKSGFVPWREKEASHIFDISEIVETEYYDRLGAFARGVVHDENCYAMGGVSGHAGLFTAAGDLARFCAEVLRGLDGKSRMFPRELSSRFFRKRCIPSGSTWCLGWDSPTEGTSQSGRHFSKNSIGHLGYTGPSLWIDLDKRISVVFLNNRVKLGRDSANIKKLRPLIHDLVMEALGV